MALEKIDFDSIQEQDLLELLETQVPEGLLIDYKLTNYGNSDKEKRELLKDVSAFANSHGGHLILGVKEKKGIATNLIGMDIDTDSEILRMEQILRNGLEPSILGIRIKGISLSNKNKAILVRIPRSWNSPHRVVSQKVNRFYIRHSAGVHEPSIGELRILFNQTTTALEKACRFRDERIAGIISGKGLRPLEGSGRLILHIVPVSSFSGMINLDLKDVFEKGKNFIPIRSPSGMSAKFNYHGFINERGGVKNNGYTQIFRNGILEATKSNIMYEENGLNIIQGAELEGGIFQQFDKYIQGLKKINVPPPLIVMFTLEGVLGAHYVVNQYTYGDDPPLPDSNIKLPECLIDEYGTEQDHHKAVQPAFDALWNAIGYSHSQFFNDDGMWAGKT